jgi:hypothetical protein
MSISNIYIDQGTDFITTLYVNDDNGVALDLTAYSVEAHIRKTYTSTNFEPFTTSFSTDRSDGQISISMSNIATANLNAGRYVYDVVLTGPSPNFSKTRVVEGTVVINPGVTH